MFSPSLVSMMLHSVWSDLAQDLPMRRFQYSKDVADDIWRTVQRYGQPEAGVPKLPVLGRTRSSAIFEALGGDLFITKFMEGDGYFFYGRVGVDRLARTYLDRHELPSEEEYLDLGTPVLSLAAVGSTSTSTFESDCDAWLRAAAASGAQKTIRVALIDQGKRALNQTPNDFGGNLQHLETKDIEMSDHALAVLWALLGRLRAHGILDQVELLCALVKEPGPQVGRKCFEHASAVELAHAADLVQQQMAGVAMPIVTNVSMGTHCGPHNGQSPLEDFLRATGAVASERFLVVAAGNDGLRGIAAKRELEDGVREYIRLATGSVGCGELLIEFWWRDDSGNGLAVGVTLTDLQGTPVCPTIDIDSGLAGSTLSAVGSIGGVICSSLYHARTHQDMNCIAFALSTRAAGALADLHLDIALECKSDVVVNTWVVVSADRGTAFVSGTSEGSVTIPATEEAALSVAGGEKSGQPWAHSSRGPTAHYDAPGTSSGRTTGPYLTHRAQLGRAGLQGTSFAAPLVSADVVQVLVGGWRPTSSTTTEDVAKQVLLANGISPSPIRSPRTGYGVIPK